MMQMPSNRTLIKLAIAAAVVIMLYYVFVAKPADRYLDYELESGPFEDVDDMMDDEEADYMMMDDEEYDDEDGDYEDDDYEDDDYEDDSEDDYEGEIIDLDDEEYDMEDDVFADYEDGLSVSYDEEMDDVEDFEVYENDVGMDISDISDMNLSYE